MPGSGADDFERRLERLFAEAPAFTDAALFAAEVQGRLDRGQALRRAVMGVAGGAGAAVAAAQLAASNFGVRLEEASAASAEALEGGLALVGRDGSSLAASGMPGEIMWLVAGLAALALAFLATRFADQV